MSKWEKFFYLVYITTWVMTIVLFCMTVGGCVK